jgi:hypothetical protein
MAGDVKLPNDLDLVPRPKITGAVFILSYIFMTCCYVITRTFVFFSFKFWIELAAGVEDNEAVGCLIPTYHPLSLSVQTENVIMMKCKYFGRYT